ncbi:tRNA (adenosine(37)-N6)-dimethylallyltransferase MiaA [Bartonella sp. DGB1]|uniref:tRNA (adenosine(37)-N6)-dimethylallyltransferase MiaA n=1 Tax=Bartonella sp. DGB1 TaxID=3239807 RepID=UPI0035248745
MINRKIVLIAGPTASGKSDFANKIAKKHNMVIVNCDSMQQYSPLAILTARPTIEIQQEIEHYLYGYLNYDEISSVGRWYNDVRFLLHDKLKNKNIVFVGGTGLYFRALEGGLSAIPDIDAKLRQKWRKMLSEIGSIELHKILQTLDNPISKIIKNTDGQRIVRALEVKESTEKSLLYWQSKKGDNLIKDFSIKRYLFMPERDYLTSLIEKRLNIMLQHGVIQEVEDFLTLNVPSDSPLTKVIGVEEIKLFLQKKIDKLSMIELIIKKTRNYAKRQQTWFNNQLDDQWQRIENSSNLVTII